MLPDNVKGAFILVAAAGFFSCMVAVIKLAGEHLHVTQILLLRQLGMALIMLPLWLTKPVDSFRTRRFGLLAARLTLGSIAMVCGFTAFIHLPLADATAIGFAKSFFVTIFAVIFLGEVVGTYRWSAVVVGFVGVLIMLQPGADAFSVYGLLAIIGAAAAGGVMVIIRHLTRTESVQVIMSFHVVGVAFVMLLPALMNWQPLTPYLWLLITILAITAYLGQRLNVLAYSLGEASLLASLDYIRLLYAVLLGWWLFDQLPGSATLFGASVIVAAAIFTVYREARRKQVVSRAPVETA